MSKSKFGVFCIEAEWETNIEDKKTVRPILEILEKVRELSFIHRRVATRDGFKHLIDLWCKDKKYSKYKVLVLESHGNRKDGLFLHGEDENNWDTISLEDLKKMINGRGGNRVIYFGGCKILDQDEKELKDFLRETKLKALIGYSNTVFWIETLAFQLLTLAALTDYEHVGWAKRSLEKFEYLEKTLGIKFIIDS